VFAAEGSFVAAVASAKPMRLALSYLGEGKNEQPAESLARDIDHAPSFNAACWR
jgi:hypothetical protein